MKRHNRTLLKLMRPPRPPSIILGRLFPPIEQFTPTYARRLRLTFKVHSRKIAARVRTTEDALLRWERGAWDPPDITWVARVREALRSCVRPKVAAYLASLEAAADPAVLQTQSGKYLPRIRATGVPFRLKDYDAEP